MSDDAVQQIKSELSLVDVIGRYTTLKKKGNRYFACCPFHSEKTPSFSVDAQKGFFYCFGCKKGGDHFKFIQEIENLSFVEALEFLADQAGIELPKRGLKGPDRKTVDLYRAINEQALLFFEKRLDRDGDVRAYLEKRGIHHSTMKLFRLGVAPDSWDGLFQKLRDQFPPEALAKSGLFKAGKTGGFYDLFRDRRIMFPIFDVHNHVVAFGGRRWIEEEEGSQSPKYINSPESPIYTKGKHVYNLNFARPYLKKTPEIIVVEGYMDVIQVYQAGFGAVVAPLGTAFTADQARMVKRYAKSIVLNFDGDQAGFQAAQKSIEVLLGQDLEPRVITLPEGMDPDDLILKEGAEGYRGYQQRAEDFFDFLYHRFHPQGQEMNPRAASALVQQMVPHLQAIRDPIIREGYIKQLSERTGASADSIHYLLNLKKKSEPTPQKKPLAPQPKRGVTKLSLMEEQVLRILLKVPKAREVFPEEDQALFDQVLSQLFGDRPGVLSFLQGEESDRLDLLEEMPDELAQQVKHIFLEDDLDPDSYEEASAHLKSLFLDLTIVYLKRQSQKISEMQRHVEVSDHARSQELSRKKMGIEKQIRSLTRQMKEAKGQKS